MGEIAAIWIKRFKGGPMDPVATAQLVAGRGLLGNADQGRRRQITIIDEAAWQDALYDLGEPVDPRARRANVMLRGVELEKTRGRILQLGDVRVRIYGETTPCYQMDEARRGLRAALKPHWRAGVFGEILDDGVIRVGDAASLLESAS